MIERAIAAPDRTAVEGLGPAARQVARNARGEKAPGQSPPTTPDFTLGRTGPPRRQSALLRPAGPRQVALLRRARSRMDPASSVEGAVHADLQAGDAIARGEA